MFTKKLLAVACAAITLAFAFALSAYAAPVTVEEAFDNGMEATSAATTPMH